MFGKSEVLTPEKMVRMLDACYDLAILGNKLSPSIESMADDYLKKYPDPSQAVKKMMKNQILKCTTSGFVTGIGGIITLSFTLPANISSVLYIQIRMIACTAYMAGYNIQSDQVKTFVYACLAGVSVSNILKKIGVKDGEKVAINIIKKIPGKVLIEINKKVGFRLVTKFGQKGLVNFRKMVPFVGAAIGGSLDLVETKVISSRAYSWFFDENFIVKDDNNVIEVEIDN